MIVIGLTGSFGTGKSLVASVFRSLGAKVLDADRIAHAELRKGSGAYKKIVKAFGSGIAAGDGGIDRKALAKMVFGHRGRLNRLNAMIHPQVIKHIKDEIKKAGKTGVVVIDAPLLIEANLTGLVDILVVVKAPRAKQIERCVKKFRIGRNECIRRIDSQMPLESKLRLADHIVNNGGTKSQTKKEAVRIWKEIKTWI